jgi:SNF2 family DNA or RNA helicase
MDMVERGLRSDPNNVIQSVRIDGKVAANKRSFAIQKLRDDPKIRVILVTIACGACG